MKQEPLIQNAWAWISARRQWILVRPVYATESRSDIMRAAREAGFTYRIALRKPRKAPTRGCR